MNTLIGWHPPALKHDALMLARFDQHVSARGKLERRIVWNLYAHLARAGFLPHSVFDGEDTTRTRTARDAMELIFNLDEASARFYKAHKASEGWHGVLLVLGNGEDVLSDWNYFADDRDGFNVAMDAFNPEDYA